jgi:hypothetical protein
MRRLARRMDLSMNTEISSKLTCFAVALMMNGLILAGVNYLFNSMTNRRLGSFAVATPAQPADRSLERLRGWQRMAEGG